MFCSFSSIVNAATSAAARAGGDSAASHTLLLARRPLTQSGKGAKYCALTAPAAPRTRLQVDFMMNPTLEERATIVGTQRQNVVDSRGIGLAFEELRGPQQARVSQHGGPDSGTHAMQSNTRSWAGLARSVQYLSRAIAGIRVEDAGDQDGLRTGRAGRNQLPGLAERPSPLTPPLNGSVRQKECVPIGAHPATDRKMLLWDAFSIRDKLTTERSEDIRRPSWADLHRQNVTYTGTSAVYNTHISLGRYFRLTALAQP